jgi:hypothetical protein
MDLTPQMDLTPNGPDPGLTIAWALSAYSFQKLLVRTRGASWPMFGWATMEVALLTLLLASGWAARSPLIIMYLVLVGASVLRFQPILIGYVTSLCLAAYAFQAWITPTPDCKNSAPFNMTEGLPMALGILCIGLIQYFALRRSQTAVELVANRKS